MPKRLIIDCDPGIDDAVAVMVAMFDPRLEVLALTTTAGAVDAARTTRNALSLVETVDPPRHPRIGAGCDPEDAPVSDFAILYGQEGLGAWMPETIERQHLIASDKLMAEEIRSYENDVTLLCVGPLTNVGRMLARDPNLATTIKRVIIVGGALDGPGDVTAAAEFNMHFDPKAADQVFRSATTKILIPNRVSHELNFSLELLELITDEEHPVAKVLSAMLPHYFRTSRQHLGREAMVLPAVVGYLMVVEPQLFTTTEETVAVETTGTLTRGALIADRRSHTGKQPNMEVADSIDIDAATVAFRRALKFALQSSV